MSIEQLLNQRNTTDIKLYMLNTTITGIKYDREVFRGECECDCANHDCDCNCFDDCDCFDDCGHSHDDCDCISLI